MHVKSLTKIGLLSGVIILLTALGCKTPTQNINEVQTNETGITEIETVGNEQVSNEGIFGLNEETNTVITSTPSESPEATENLGNGATTAPSASPSASETPSATPTLTLAPSPTPTSDEDLLLKQQAEKIAEIYGTYTNKDSEAFKNLKDLKQYATTEFQAWLDLQTRKIIDPKAAFYGVTTKTLSSAIIESSGNAKKVLITVKKEEITITSATPKVSYKIILLNFAKEKDEWKISEIYWQ